MDPYYTHMQAHAYLGTRSHKNEDRAVLTWLHIGNHACAHSCAHWQRHAHMNVHAQQHTYKHEYTHRRAHTYACTHAHRHAGMHARMHTHDSEIVSQYCSCGDLLVPMLSF